MIEGNLQAQFLEEINAHIGIIRKVSRIYFHDPIDRQDLFQEIVYQLWRSYPAFEKRSKVSTWIYQVALNTAITLFRKGQRQTAKERLSEHHLTLAEPPEPATEERILSLYNAIHTLSPVDKLIVLMQLEGNSYEEIALVSGLTRTNVSVRLVRIKKVLEMKLKNKI